ncbi:MAG: hypothetical protein JOY89_14495 [Solirubrobacterales bacterium]|nr:hypothetical protein [Solirubrobacterales bacterium]
MPSNAVMPRARELWLDREAGFNDPETPLEELVGHYLHATLSDPRLARLLLWGGTGRT